MTISMHHIVMSYGNAMQSEDSNVQGEIGKKIQVCIRYKEKSWSGFTALMDSMLRNSPYTMHVYKILEQKCAVLPLQISNVPI